MKILGINAFHPDSSACLVIDGKVVAAIEEERIVRVKHWAGFPENAILSCLKVANIKPSEIDKIAVNRDSDAHKKEKLLYALRSRPSLSNIVDRINNRKKVGKISSLLSNLLGISEKKIEDKIIPVEHHLAHLGSTFLSSPYNSSVICSVDGFGDFISTMWGLGEGNKLTIEDYVTFPHSLGMLYQSITQFLGFWNYGDEYKVMGMAAYGHPEYLNEVRELIEIKDGGKFELEPKYFQHPVEGVSMEFDGGYPVIGPVFAKEMTKLLGNPREKDEPIVQKHKDIASSLQKVYEEVFFNLLKHLNRIFPGINNLCLAGGCAQNSLANGKITSNSNFEKVWIQPAAGDAGGALGAALTVSNMYNNEKKYKMNSPSLGISYSNEEIKALIENKDLSLFEKIYFANDNELINYVVASIIEGKVIGFFHGAFEWGPRALGNRSIIVDPRLKNMKKLLNEKIKKREGFRPFAPSVLREQVDQWFEKDEDVPFMTHVFKIKKEKRKLIPAVTHEDGTGRIQSVTKDFNERYYNIIRKFHKITKVPMILNTSFNENEPIVNTPEEALNCFLRTKMDTLVLENHIILR